MPETHRKYDIHLILGRNPGSRRQGKGAPSFRQKTQGKTTTRGEKGILSGRCRSQEKAEGRERSLKKKRGDIRKAGASRGASRP